VREEKDSFWIWHSNNAQTQFEAFWESENENFKNNFRMCLQDVWMPTTAALNVKKRFKKYLKARYKEYLDLDFQAFMDKIKDKGDPQCQALT
jgi:hypothetical protein